jgi:dienelactone hydrolase
MHRVLRMKFNRRNFLRIALGASLPLLTGCAAHRATHDEQFAETMFDFKRDDRFKRPVLRTVSGSGPAVVLLHELQGLSWEDMLLAHRIADEGFQVYLPVLFGTVKENSVGFGYFQSCVSGEFECSKLSARSSILDWLEEVCTRVSEDTSGGRIGVIGMCLTGTFPLALLQDRVQAAVLCQPSLPFTALLGRPIGAQKTDIGLSVKDLDVAQHSNVPFLTMRYAGDPRCPQERMAKLRDLFKQRLADIELAGEGHSTLAGNFNASAFTETIQYLKVRLGSKSGPIRMNLAKLEGKDCEITADGNWRAV